MKKKIEVQLKNPNDCEHFKEVGCIKDICTCYTLVETDEEKAEIYAKQMWGEYYDNEYDTGTDLTYGEACKKDFLAGIVYQKQQNKNLYSEEEVLSILRGFELTYDGKASESKLQKWFEKYKKR